MKHRKNFYRVATDSDRQRLPKSFSRLMLIKVDKGKEVSAQNVIPLESLVDAVIYGHVSLASHVQGRRSTYKLLERFYTGMAVLDFQYIAKDCTHCVGLQKPPKTGNPKHLAVVQRVKNLSSEVQIDLMDFRGNPSVGSCGTVTYN